MNWLKSPRCIKVTLGEVSNKDEKGEPIMDGDTVVLTYDKEHKGEQKKFYGASLPVLMDVRPVIVELVEKGFALDSERQSLVGHQRESNRRGIKRNDKGMEVSIDLEQEQVITAALNPEMYEKLRTTKRDTIREMLESIADDKILRAVVSLIISSMRDDFVEGDNGRPKEEDIDRFLAGVDIETMIDCVSATLDINKRALFKGFRLPFLKVLEKKAQAWIEEGTSIMEKEREIDITQTGKTTEPDEETMIPESQSSTETTSSPLEPTSSQEESPSSGS